MDLEIKLNDILNDHPKKSKSVMNRKAKEFI